MTSNIFIRISTVDHSVVGNRLTKLIVQQSRHLQDKTITSHFLSTTPTSLKQLVISMQVLITQFQTTICL